jgi:hypothetical protein
MNIPLIYMLGKGDLRKGMDHLYGRKAMKSEPSKRRWQGHDPEELLLVLIALLFITSLVLGILHVALIDPSIVVK